MQNAECIMTERKEEAMRLNWTMLLLSVVLLGSARAEDYFAKGNAAFEEQDYAEAARLYTLHLQEHPDDANALYNRALTYAGRSIADTAIRDLSRVIELRPNDTAAYALRGSEYYYQASISNMSAEMVQRIFAEDDEDTIYVPSDSIRLEYAPAFADLSRAISLDSTQPGFYRTRGMCHAELQDYEEAIADYSVAIRLNPGESQAYVARADAYRRSGNYNPAISDLSRVIELKPYAEAYLTRGEVYEEKGRPDTAIFDFTRAIELDSTSARAYDRRARACYATGQPDSAKLDWQKAHKLDDDYPSSPEGKRLLMQKK